MELSLEKPAASRMTRRKAGADHLSILHDWSVKGGYKMEKIIISVENLSVTAELFDTPTAKKILENLPIDGSANVWGDEIYFTIPLTLEQESDAREDVEVGDLAYWPAGPAFCIFFGPTPVSTGDQPQAYSPVNVYGRISGDAGQFKSVAGGAAIHVKRAN
jgi:hypothetical protein